MSDEIILEDNNTDVLEYIEVSNIGTGVLDSNGNMVVLSEYDPTIPIIRPEYIAENVANKRTNFDSPNDVEYPTTLAVSTLVTLYADKNYRHTQNIPSNLWIIVHNLNKRPSVIVTDSAGTVVEGLVRYYDLNNLAVEFSAGFSGYAELN